MNGCREAQSDKNAYDIHTINIQVLPVYFCTSYIQRFVYSIPNQTGVDGFEFSCIPRNQWSETKLCQKKPGNDLCTVLVNTPAARSFHAVLIVWFEFFLLILNGTKSMGHPAYGIAYISPALLTDL